MAPPISKRAKQNSPTSPSPPIPLPGIAVGLFAAVAAGFAASRALRRKRLVQSSQDEQQPISTGEIEIEDRDDSSVLINANGTITVAQGPSKPAAGLKPVFDALEKVPCVQKRDALLLEECRGEDKDEKGEEEKYGNGHNEGAENGDDFEEGDKEGEPVENGKASEEESETAEIFVKIEASLTADDSSVEALQNSILEEGEKKEEEEETEAEGKGKEGEDSGIIDDKDVYNEGYGDSSSVDQQPSPVLINGRIIDFCEETPDFKDGPDHLSNGSNSLSDAISESSIQEVSSAPVKPFVCTEETPEVKPGFSVALNQTGQGDAFPENRSWYSDEKCFHPLEDGLSEMRKEVPEFVENLLQIDRQLIDMKHDWAILNDDALDLKLTEHDVGVGLLDLKPVLVEIKEEKCPDDKVNQIRFEILPDAMEVKGNSIAFEGKISIKEFTLDVGVVESSKINGKVLSNGSSLPEELHDLESIGESEHDLESTREVTDDFTCLPFKGETIAASMQSSGKVVLDESLNEPCIFEGTIPDESSLQTGQKETDGIISDIHGEPEVPPALELSGNDTQVSFEGDLHDGALGKEMGCVGSDTSDELVIVEGISEEPELQPAAQELDGVDETYTNAENSVKLGQEQSSLFTSSKGITEIGDLSCEGNTNNVNREDISDGRSGQIVVKERIHEREQEIEEIIRSCDTNDLVYEKMKLTSLTDLACAVDNTTKDADYLVSKEVVHQRGLQPKGVSVRKILEYLPLEIGFICLLIALVSSVLWYLEALPSICL